ncbi:LAFE_0E01200g1_1 [Lachancea fermentati]|uniref:LAFE_0E01200g1_1 n=1 Tax=Lachancea fermentati TaxID=4955 RepID=A0A1G4MCA4_LACFM|nr:LAFE_0E01200g1_1 [Lachancea fermentati]
MALRKAGFGYNLRTIAESYRAVTPFCLFRGFSIQQQCQSRSVHQTSKNEHTPLLSTDKLSTFNVMSLKALKTECRSRGLKVSGRKLELVDRILAFENMRPSSGSISNEAARLIHTTRPKLSRSDRKPVDAVKIPNIAATEAALDQPEKDYIVKIPPLSKSAAQKPVTKLEKELDSRSGQTNQPPTVSTPDHEKVIFQAEAPEEHFEIVNEEEERTTENKVSLHHNSESSQENLNKRDKTFILGFVAIVTGWWTLKYVGKTEHGKQ